MSVEGELGFVLQPPRTVRREKGGRVGEEKQTEKKEEEEKEKEKRGRIRRKMRQSRWEPPLTHRRLLHILENLSRSPRNPLTFLVL